MASLCLEGPAAAGSSSPIEDIPEGPWPCRKSSFVPGVSVAIASGKLGNGCSMVVAVLVPSGMGWPDRLGGVPASAKRAFAY